MCVPLRASALTLYCFCFVVPNTVPSLNFLPPIGWEERVVSFESSSSRHREKRNGSSLKQRDANTKKGKERGGKKDERQVMLAGPKFQT